MSQREDDEPAEGRRSLFGRFLRGVADGVAEERRRERAARASTASAEATEGIESRDAIEPPESTDAAASTEPAGAPRNGPAATEARGARTAEPPARAAEPNWNPAPKPGLYASRPDLPPPPPIARHNAPRIHRPPGALAEPDFLATCTRGNDCAVACPVDAIAPIEHGPEAGTPRIDATRRACVSCVDTPCITACGPGALTLARGVKMGTAKIAVSACLAYRGTGCTACVDDCPVPGAMTLTNGRPRIVADACTGCGVCRQVCPAPKNAVLLTPGV